MMRSNKKFGTCKFFNTPRGCNKGDDCAFTHESGNDDFGSNDNSRMKPRQPTSGSFSHQTKQNMDTNPNYSQSSQYSQPQSHSSQSIQSSQTGSKICGFFLKGTCTNTNCKFFHGYAENLQNANLEKVHDKNLISLTLISDKKFISADETTIKIWMITESEHQMIGSQSFNEEKITKVIYSSEKVMAATIVEKMISSTAKIYVITDKGIIFQNSDLKRINDMIEIDSYILAVGEGNQIEVFRLDMVQGSLTKVNLINNDIDKSDMMCITFSAIKSLFFVGHKSGMLAAYSPDNQTILKPVGMLKIHDGAINRIYLKDYVIENVTQQFLMTCSSDGTLKVYKSDESFANISTKNFDSGVNDIFQTFDYEKTEYFVVSLENGEMVVINLGLEVVFKIPAIMPSQKRYAINLLNPCKNDVEGNFFIVSDGNSINVNIWIKQGAIEKIVPSAGQQHDSSSRGGSRGTYRGKGGHGGGNQPRSQNRYGDRDQNY